MKEKFFMLLGKGEGEDVEFKKNERSVVETVCAFANTFGGYVLVGVDDGGKIVGVSKKTKERISNHLHALSPYPQVKIHEINIDGKNVLLIEVKRSNTLVSYGNSAYIRVGRSNRALSVGEMIERSVELTAIKFDSLPSPYGPKIIKREYVEWYLEQREKFRNISARGSYEENLKKLKIIVKKDGSYKATYGGILFFSEEPERYISSASLRVIDFRNGESIVKFTGPVWKIIDGAYNHILSLLKVIELRIGPRRGRFLEYPEYAIREAIINALAHRNYLIDADVRIFIYEDKMLIRSPGSFPPGVTIDAPEHHPRNPLLCQYLYDTGYIERYGFGIQRIKESCNEHPLCEVDFDVRSSRVDVILQKTSPELDDIDRKIISMLKNNPMRSGEIAERIGMSKVATLQRLKKLMEMGFIKKIGSGPGTRYLS